MKKKNFKCYEAPKVEVVEMELQDSLLLIVSQENGPSTAEPGGDGDEGA